MVLQVTSSSDINLVLEYREGEGTVNSLEKATESKKRCSLSKPAYQRGL